MLINLFLYKLINIFTNFAAKINFQNSMKKDKAEHPKRKNFIKLPTYPGGKDALGKYIKENLRYPEEAEKNNISGSVYVGFDVDHMGEVSGAKIIKGI